MISAQPRQPRQSIGLLRPQQAGIWFAILSMAAGVAAYYEIFTGFSFWDDEGTLLQSVKQYVSGMRLYDQVFTSYGPVYYFYNRLLRLASGTPVTHDVTRMSSLIPWLLTALICAWIVLKLTKSLLLASATHLFTFATLAFFRQAPGHPHELCIVLLVSLVAVGLWTPVQRYRLMAMILLGAIPAALLLIKVNIGIFAILAVALAVLIHGPRNSVSRLALIAVGAAYIILPFMLMKAHLGERVADYYCALLTVSAVLMLVVRFRETIAVSLSFRDCWIVLASFAGALAGILLTLKIQGSSLSAVWYWLVLANLRVSVNQGYWSPVPVSKLWIVSMGAGAVSALYFVWKGLRKDEIEQQLHYLKLIFAVLAGVVVFALHHSLLGFVTPFCWLVLYPPSDASGTVGAFPRTLLCSVTVLQTLYAYPTTGYQAKFIQILLIVVVMVCLGDFFLWQQDKHPVVWPSFLRAAVPVLLLCVPAYYLAAAYVQRRSYDSMISLGLPGAQRIHVSPTVEQDYSWLVFNLKAQCDVFVGLPEIPSLHVWTAMAPVVGTENDAWFVTDTGKQQETASTVLSQHSRACAVYNPDIVKFWNRSHQDVHAAPVARYIDEHFKVVGSTHRYYLLVPKERDVAIASSSSTEGMSSGATMAEIDTRLASAGDTLASGIR
jgi:hypothetical protein